MAPPGTPAADPREIAAIKSSWSRPASAPFKGLTSRALASSLHPDRAHDKPLLDRLQAMAPRNGKGSFIRQLSALRSDGYSELQNIRCLTLVVAASHDQLAAPAEAQQMAAQIPGGASTVLIRMRAT